MGRPRGGSPLADGAGPHRLYGSEIERSLAVVMIGGLVTSTLFTLLALPTFYQVVHNAQERFHRRRTAPAREV